MPLVLAEVREAPSQATQGPGWLSSSSCFFCGDRLVGGALNQGFPPPHPFLSLTLLAFAIFLELPPFLQPLLIFLLGLQTYFYLHKPVLWLGGAGELVKEMTDKRKGKCLLFVEK